MRPNAGGQTGEETISVGRLDRAVHKYWLSGARSPHVTRPTRPQLERRCRPVRPAGGCRHCERRGIDANSCGMQIVSLDEAPAVLEAAEEVGAASRGGGRFPLEVSLDDDR